MTCVVERNKHKARVDGKSALTRQRCGASKREKRCKWEVEAEAHDKKISTEKRVTSKFTKYYVNILLIHCHMCHITDSTVAHTSLQLYSSSLILGSFQFNSVACQQCSKSKAPSCPPRRYPITRSLVLSQTCF